MLGRNPVCDNDKNLLLPLLFGSELPTNINFSPLEDFVSSKLTFPNVTISPGNSLVDSESLACFNLISFAEISLPLLLLLTQKMGRVAGAEYVGDDMQASSLRVPVCARKYIY